MKLIINNLRSKGPWKARTWIYVRLSHSWAQLPKTSLKQLMET
jgi:hypothetical protein